MERFRLRVRHEPKRGDIWELQLFPDEPRGITREASVRTLATCSAPAATNWLRQIAHPYLQRCKEPGPIAAEQFGATTTPRWLEQEDGMRLALAFSAARWLAGAGQRRMFRDSLAALPSEVLLYWFTLCFYGYRQAAGRAALRVLLTHQEPSEDDEVPAARAREEPVAAGVESAHQQTLRLPRRGFGAERAGHLFGGPGQPDEALPAKPRHSGRSRKIAAAKGGPA
jgi:hypothetical protein